MDDQTRNTWKCPQCDAENPQRAAVCQKCGFSFIVELPPVPKKRDVLTTGCLVLFGVFLLLFFILSRMHLLPEASVRSRVSRVQSDLRSLSTAVEAYMVDANQYVAAARGDEGINAFLPKGDPGREIFTFRRRQADRPDDQIMTLTTPTAFITSYPPDPYAKTRGDPHLQIRGTVYGYYNHLDKGYIVFSAGPDGDYDIHPEKDYDALTTRPLPQLLMKTYDPTNGSKSDGDIWRIKQ